MNRRRLIRGIQLVVAITLASLGYQLYRSLRAEQASFGPVLAGMKPLWLALGSLLALQEGVFGGIRMFVLARVLTPEIKVRHGIVSEFVLMFVAGVTPGQLGAPISQVVVLVNAGMKVAEVATAEFMTAFCTLTFFLLTALGLMVLRGNGLLVLPKEAAALDYFVALSACVFGLTLLGLIVCAVFPPLLKGVVRACARITSPLWQLIVGWISRPARMRAFRDRDIARKGHLSSRLLGGIDAVHQGFQVYLARGKLAVLAAFGLTLGFFCSRFAVTYFILKGLGLSTTPSTFIALGPPIVQIILVQALLNFALYLSPTPGASGIAEVGSAALMRPWVSGAYQVPYLILWRVMALFLCMFVGGIYVFRYLGADVLEAEAKKAEDEQRRLDDERMSSQPEAPEGSRPKSSAPDPQPAPARSSLGES